jgi:hypothetical protein
MKRKTLTVALAFALAGSLTMTSCIGSFPLFHKVLDWNKHIDGEKWVNELVFVVLNIIPVYGVASFIDIVILNSIEFWTGESPIAQTAGIRTVQTPEGAYTIETKADGYAITKEGEAQAVNFLFDKTDKSWSMDANGERHKLLKYSDNNEKAVIYLSGGEEMTVELNAAGVTALLQSHSL